MNRLIPLARFLKSDKNGILICLIGTFVQALHTYKIIFYSSQLQEVWMKHTQATLAGLFFSLGLVMYTFRTGSVNIHKPNGLVDYEKKKIRNKYKYYANGFAVFEVLINLHYWTRFFIIEKLDSGVEITILSWYDWGAALFYSFFLPFFIASYAGHINLSSKKDNLEEDIEFQILKNYKKQDKHYLKVKIKE